MTNHPLYLPGYLTIGFTSRTSKKGELEPLFQRLGE
jgi:hypothetical protein